MPSVDLPDVRIRYALEGPAGAPVLLLAHSLGLDASLWDPQAAALARRFRLLRWDGRGHGGSGVPPGPYRIEQLAGDAVGLLDALGIARAHLCGLSLGGMVGMAVAARFPERVDRLLLCNTSARAGTPEGWRARIDAVRAGGVASVEEAVLARWFTPAFREREPAAVERIRGVLRATPAEGYVACCAAIGEMDQREAVGAIRAPTLVIAGTHDQATPAADGRFLAGRIPGARYLELPAAHLSNVEAAEAFTAAALAFLPEP